MRKAQEINTQELVKNAENSQHKEAFKVIEKTSTYRFGVGARLDADGTSSFFLEILLSIFKENSVVDLAYMERSLILLKELKASKYELICTDDNSVSSEISLTEQNLGNEVKKIRSAINRTLV